MTTKTALQVAPEPTLAKKRAKAQSKKGRRSASKKSSKRKSHCKQASVQRLVRIEDARRDLLQLVCLNSEAITQARIDDALQGKYLSAKFWFEAVGLCATKGDEVEDGVQQESLGSRLVQRFGLAIPKDAEVREVAKVTLDTGAATGAPVES